MPGLILGRSRGQGIKIGDGVVINILSTSSGSCRLQIVAPRSMKILRVPEEDKKAVTQSSNP